MRTGKPLNRWNTLLKHVIRYMGKDGTLRRAPSPTHASIRQWHGGALVFLSAGRFSHFFLSGGLHRQWTAVAEVNVIEATTTPMHASAPTTNAQCMCMLMPCTNPWLHVKPTTTWNQIRSSLTAVSARVEGTRHRCTRLVLNSCLQNQSYAKHQGSHWCTKA